MLIFHGNDWHKHLSPDQLLQVSDDWMAWFKRLGDQGKAIAGNALLPEGKIVSGRLGRNVTDGRFAESSEAVCGYFVLTVNEMDDAVRIAQDCPGLAHGVRVEVRPMAEECPLAAEAHARQSQFAEAHA
jgi:hypothetical protein